MDAFTEKEGEIQEGLAQQVEASLDLMDNAVAKEYREAKLLAPGLVAQEAQPIDFLHVVDYHPLLAAKRMALYWKFRKELFAERWLLPMTCTGTGALNAEDIAVLRSGYLIGGNDTWVLDLSRSPFEEFLFLRVQFYVVDVVARTRPRVPPLRIIWAIHHAKCTAANAMRSAECNRFIKCMPTKIASISVAYTYQPGQEQLLDYLGHKQQQILQLTTNRSNVPVVAANSFTETLAALEERGHDRRFLPHCLGGDYDYERDLSEFIRTRLTIEDAMASAPPVRNGLRLLPAHPVAAATTPVSSLVRAGNFPASSARTNAEAGATNLAEAKTPAAASTPLPPPSKRTGPTRQRVLPLVVAMSTVADRTECLGDDQATKPAALTTTTVDDAQPASMPGLDTDTPVAVTAAAASLTDATARMEEDDETTRQPATHTTTAAASAISVSVDDETTSAATSSSSVPTNKRKRPPYSTLQTAKLKQLREQFERQQQENESVRVDNRRLEGLLSRARLIVAMTQGSSPDEAAM